MFCGFEAYAPDPLHRYLGRFFHGKGDFAAEGTAKLFGGGVSSRREPGLREIAGSGFGSRIRASLVILVAKTGCRKASGKGGCSDET